MSALATATGAINLGQGFPDVDGPSSVADAAIDAIREGRGNQYPPGPGVPVLRRAVAQHQGDYYGIHLDAETDVLVTAGATEAIAAAMLAFVDAGDEVIALEPFYDSYRATIAMARGRCVPVRLDPPDFRLSEQRLRDAVTERTTVILLNSPHNPTGAVLSRAELEVVARVAIEHDLIVVTDEVYEHLAFDERRTSPSLRCPTWQSGPSRSRAWARPSRSPDGRSAGSPGRPTSSDAVRTTKQYLTFVSGGPFQFAAAARLTSGWVGFRPAHVDGFAPRLARRPGSSSWG